MQAKRKLARTHSCHATPRPRCGRDRVASLLPLLAVTAGLLFGPPAEAQEHETGRVEGRVVAAESGVPLPGVDVTIAELDLRARSDERGYYAFRRVPSGAVTVSFHRLGYRAYEADVEVEAGGRAALDAVLSSEPIGLNPVLIQSQRTRMVGDPLNLSAIPGSAHFLSTQDLEARKLAFDNVHDVLRRVPGVNVQDEEGYGLRPNIGLRGTGSSRSSKVTLMEDGVLIAPAPYAAPAAYYFPVMGRMEAVEVRKGSSQIRYGPRTIGGAINLVSASVPERRSWDLDLQGGEDRMFRARARAGDSTERFGWMAETYQLRTDGFKAFPDGGGTGFRVSDYTMKLRVNTPREASRYQELELKLGYHDHLSDETYLGLTHEDFRTNALLRYPASRPDEIASEHVQVRLQHFLRASEHVDLTTTAYHHDFARNWYKLQSVRGQSISAVVDAPTEYADELAVLRGAGSEADALTVRANNREYFSQGVQSVLGLRFGEGEVSHDVEVGLRLHRDREDRFQWEDGYQMAGGNPVRSSEGVPGTQANRVADARALSAYVQNEIGIGERWTVVPGVRYERINLTRTDYPTAEPNREEPSGVRETTVTAVAPGVGAVFAVDPSLHLFAGVHRGFGPPGPGAAEETRPETSVNYELGTRVRRSGLGLQVAGFFNDYRNILGQATLATGETGVGDMFNGGAVHTLGLETSFDYDLAWGQDLPVRLPIDLSYTYTRSTFRTAFESDFDPWGVVEPGDHLPYLPAHQLSGSVGVEDAGWSVTLVATGASAMRTRAGQGPFEEHDSTDRFVVFNLQGEYELQRFGNVLLYGGAQNVLDRHYVASLRPAGARPGLPRTLFAGVRIRP